MTAHTAGSTTGHDAPRTRSAPGGVGWRLARSTIALARPLAGRRFFPLWGVLQHRGRTSGTRYAIPVVMRGHGDAIVIPMPWGSRTNWVRNVLAAGGCTVRWRGRTRAMGSPRIIGPAEAMPAFGPVLRRVAGGIPQYLELRPA